MHQGLSAIAILPNPSLLPSLGSFSIEDMLMSRGHTFSTVKCGARGIGPLQITRADRGLVGTEAAPCPQLLLAREEHLFLLAGLFEHKQLVHVLVALPGKGGTTKRDGEGLNRLIDLRP